MTEIPEDWPFDQAPNVSAINTVRVLDDSLPILTVTHYSDDHSWAFVCGTTNATEDGRVIGMDCALLRDPTLCSIADLPPGWTAWRESRTAKFVERVDANSSKCMDAGNVLIEKLNAGQIKFSYSPNSTTTIIARATLEKSSAQSTKPRQDSEANKAEDFRQKADNLQEEAKYIEAIENYTKAIEFDPESEHSFLGRGNANLALKRYRTAIADFDRVVQLYHILEAEAKARKARGGRLSTIQWLQFPELCANAYNNRGVAKNNLGDNAGACADFRESCGLGNSLGCENVKKICNQESLDSRPSSDTAETRRPSTSQGLEGTVWDGQSDERYSRASNETISRQFFCAFGKEEISCQVRLQAASKVGWQRVLDPLRKEYVMTQVPIPAHLYAWERDRVGTYELNGNHVHIELSDYDIDATVQGSNMEGEVTLKLESNQKARWVGLKR
jgi:tetratricopeptide (TPR) repeat protein